MLIDGSFVNKRGYERYATILCERYCIMSDIFRRKELIKFIERR